MPSTILLEIGMFQSRSRDFLVGGTEIDNEGYDEKFCFNLAVEIF